MRRLKKVFFSLFFTIMVSGTLCDTSDTIDLAFEVMDDCKYYRRKTLEEEPRFEYCSLAAAFALDQRDIGDF